MKVLVSTLLILTLSVVGFAQQPVSDYAVYRDTVYPFSLFYPKDWTQLQPTHAATRFKIAKEDGFYFTDFNINARYVDGSKNLSPENYVKGLIDSPELISSMVTQGNPTGKVISSGKIFINNRDAFYVKSRMTHRSFDEEQDLTVYQILTIFEGNYYTLTFRALTDEFDENFPIFKFIASSFVVRSTKLPVPKAKSVKRVKG